MLNWSTEQLTEAYRHLVFPRMVEEKMLLLLRQGKVSKWFSGIGQEAISVGATLAMNPNEWILPLHRNLGVFTTRGLPLTRLFHQLQGHPEGFSKGRERSFHFGSREHKICGMISHLGPQLAVATGISLAHQLRNQFPALKNGAFSHSSEAEATLVFTGDGGTSEGDFHEALNLASVWDLPVIFLIENNGYALSTPTNEQYRCRSLVDKAVGYGLEGVQIDGNNLLTVWDTIAGVRSYCIEKKRPYLVECLTFRMRGHEEASGIKYVPPTLLAEWAEKDPLLQFQNHLKSKSFSEEFFEEVKTQIKLEIETAWHAAENTAPSFVLSEELSDVYAPTIANTASTIAHTAPTVAPTASANVTTAASLTNNEDTSLGKPIESALQEKKFIEAIREGLHQAMELWPELVLMGQDIAAYGGAFKITDGLAAQFGKDRVRNTPLCESAVLGAALGYSLEGGKTMVEMQFADFVSSGFTQIVQNLAKIHYRWGQHADVVIRMPTGAGVGAGPFHSQSNEGWFMHTPGLKVVYPSNPYDAKGLLLASFQDPNPILFFEHKALYRSTVCPVPSEPYFIPLGKAAIVEEGSDLTIITYGAGVHWAQKEAAWRKPNCTIHILDLRTLLPFDKEAIRSAVQKTGKVLVLYESNITAGPGAEISAWIAEHCFEWLDAPVMRCASLDTPVPFHPELEQQYLPTARLSEKVEALLRY